jgi:hypothetical protein
MNKRQCKMSDDHKWEPAYERPDGSTAHGRCKRV